MPESSSTPSQTNLESNTIASILARKKPLIIALACVLVALGLFAIFASKSPTQAKEALQVRFGLPTFMVQDSSVEITLPIFTSTAMQAHALAEQIFIDSAPISPSQLTEQSPHEWELRFSAPKESKEYKIQVAKDFSKAITLDSSSKSAKVLGIQAYSRQKTLEIYLDKDLHLDSQKARSSVKVLDSASRDVIDKVLVQGSRLIITGEFKPNATYTIAYTHPIDEKDISISFPALQPELKFAQAGTMMSRDGDVKIGVLSTGVRKSTLSIYKIPDENLANALQYSSGYDSFGDKIFEQEISFDLSKDQTQSVLDLRELLKQDTQKGAYVLAFRTKSSDLVYPNKEGDDEWDEWAGDDEWVAYSQSPSKLLIISNIALIAEQDGEKINAYAFDSSSSEPLSSVKLSLFSSTHRLIDSATSDSKGFATLSTYKSSALGGKIIKDKDNEPSKDYALRPAYIIAESNNDKSYIPLRYDGRFYDGVDTSGAQSRKRKVFTYTDRGLANPGESIQLNALVRDERIQDAPILLTIINPRGQKVLKDKPIKPIGYGLYSYVFDTDATTLTGGYRAIWSIGSESFSRNFQVEHITPNKIRVDIDAPKSLTKDKDSLAFYLESSYLTGAKSAGLAYRVNLQATPLQYKSKAYSSFDFTLPNTQSGYDKNLQGTLDESGRASFSLPLSDLASSQNLRLGIKAQVFEATGHPVINGTAVEYFGSGSVIGVGQIPHYVDLSQPLSLPIVVLDPLKDTPIANRAIRYKIYRNNRYWWFDYDVQERFNAKIKSDINTTLIKEGSITSAAKPIALEEDLRSLVEDYDSVFIELDDGVSAPKVVWLVADMYGDAAIKANPMQLPIELDKSHYDIGESAQIRFNAKGFNYALITLSQGDLIFSSELVAINTPSTTPKMSYTIPIIAKYAPNVDVSVTLVAKDAPSSGLESSADKKRAAIKRSFGVITIPVQDPSLKLAPVINAPESIKPGSKLHIEIANPNKRKMAYTLAIVDEGILNIINFRTPDPMKLYTKINYGIMHYDNFDEFMERLFGIVHQSVLIGGDEEALTQAANFSKKRRENLIYFTSGLSDDSGKASIEYQLPNYVGSARIMLVASEQGSVGSAESSVQIAQAANLYSNIPDEIKLNDTIIAPVEVIAQDGVALKSVEIESSGEVAIKKLESSMNDKRTRFMQYLAISPKKLGEAEVTITSKVQVDSSDPSKISQKQITQSNRYILHTTTPTPAQTQEELFSLQAKERKEFKPSTVYVPESLTRKLTISPTLLFSYQDKVEYLLSYIYGCIEQSVSATMPLLLGFDGTRFESEESRKAKVQKSINRIVKFQHSSGGFGYWIDSKEDNAFGSDYAALFLTIAKAKGYEVPESSLKSYAHYASRRVQAPSELDPLKTLPLFVLALAGTPNIAAMNQVYTQSFAQLSMREKLALAASYKLSGLDSISKEIRAKLPANLLEASHYRKNVDDFDRVFGGYYYYGSALSNQALSAYFLSIIDEKPHLALLNSLAKSLQDERWLGTQDIATSLLALSTLDSSDSKAVRFILNGKEHSITKPTTFKLGDGTESLQALDTLYVSLASTGVPSASPLALPASSQNLALQREFFKIDDNGVRVSIDPATLKKGDEFYIALKLSNLGAKPVRNLALTQIIPSGWEIQNTRITNDDEQGSQASPDRAFMQANNRASYMDIGRDRVSFFFDEWLDFGSGATTYNTHQVFIKCTATLAGEYILSQALAEAMYDGEFFAKTSALAVRVR
ncbi:MG2 domain-containing protein [Helicobacter sp. XJK30-2]|uniref:MG2 domain-containing protein n=1 Tax=Helicobacter zhangjianzhongii TaxID=2974574 RepID=A0ACC6FV77_9HELI|nr:MG2 domain-containing protein [Helicobacter sp. XJK30-2]MDL0083030.1 MG2 domain-containing protein [Helicobacter sp. XJK30-2]